MIDDDGEIPDEPADAALTAEESRRAENSRRSLANLRPWRPGQSGQPAWRLDDRFVEGHELDDATAARIPTTAIVRMMPLEQAAKIIGRIERASKSQR
jgi:hypothetical protein